MFVLLTEYGIKPWERDGTGEVMLEDLKTIMLLRQYRQEGQEKQAKTEAKRQELLKRQRGG